MLDSSNSESDEEEFDFASYKMRLRIRGKRKTQARSVADRFGIGKSSLSNCFMRVIKAFNDIAGDVIVWPTGSKLLYIKEKLRGNDGLSDVIGAIDGTDIEVKGPKENCQFYINRKKRFSVTLQAVCDSQLNFTDCFAGFAGSVGDLRVFRNSDLYYWRQSIPCLTWCIPPFRNFGNLTRAQDKFNQVLSKMRQVIERAFALLKGRWRRLKYLDMNRDEMIPFTIIACCVLHNICLNGEHDTIDDFIAEGHDDTPNNEIFEEEEVIRNDANGEAKRHLEIKEAV
ncbi:PREDICTED: putative nuclease HARBI1 [Vollenhovia emeryi]|uniref:putative nuclease HARBI1 n=1 Tax=Vollenhovia emeryi TaxID=411798 RepID=UPI0005F4C576|nr:PREDICTED: putative nuclease HARBI1 [Vollenhovia emeryi]